MTKTPDEFTIHIYPYSEGGYAYDIYDCSPREVENEEELGTEDREPIDGGIHTGSDIYGAIQSACDMARTQVIPRTAQK